MLSEISTLGDYLRCYGGQLAEKVKHEASPLFSPGEEWDGRLSALLRQPFPAQGDVIMGLCEALRERNSTLVVGEMGSGKTLIALSVPYVLGDNGRPFRTLIMCPGHLVGKWQREAKETIPEANAIIVRKLADVMKLGKRKPKTCEYVIVSKDRAKLGYAWRPAVIEKQGRYWCPQCQALIADKDGVPVSLSYLKSVKRFCGRCQSSLWQADNARVRRYAISEYIKRHMKGYFDFFIADEVHELKGGSTAQGNAFGALVSSVRKTIALTGTLVGGYASNIMYILFRMDSKKLREEEIQYHDLTKWVSRYGVLERTTRYYESRDNIRSKGKRGRTVIREKPGLSPVVFSRHLLGSGVFLRLEDISLNLPPISEEVVQVPMDEELEAAYQDLESTLVIAMRAELQRGSRKLLSAYLVNLLAYPDRPFDNKHITKTTEGVEVVIAEPVELPRSKTYNKENELVKLVRNEKSQGRRVFVYCQYTGIRDMTGRLKDLLTDEGFKVDVLKASTSPEKREEWLAERVGEGVDVVIANPKLVETGLDLYDFPTMVFYQTGYSIFTLRQASRRSWRIGQKKPVKVYYLFYRGTMQEKALQLMGSKLECSLAIEGRFTEEGLAALTSGEDMTTALAKALVEGLEAEGVEQIWKKINEKNQDHLFPGQEETEEKVVVVEFAKYMNKRRRQAERLTVRVSELDGMVQEKGVPAQLTLF
jgi:SNF2 family DNA or RNA helicase